MRSARPSSPAATNRAAVITRGPHACSWCECPTWTEPPVPWTGMRDFVVPCTSCERPLQVRVNPERLAGRDVLVSLSHGLPPLDPVEELLAAPGVRGFGRRLAAAGSLVAISSVALSAIAQLSFVGTLWCAAALTIPCSLWGPASIAMARARIDRILGASRRLARSAPVEIVRARWDQWLREQRTRERERVEQPDAVLEQLERVLEPRELRRVRALAEHGDVPAAHLDDLLRHRSFWGRRDAAWSLTQRTG